MTDTATAFENINLLRDGGIAIVELDNAPMNVITLGMGRELKAVCAQLAVDEDVRVVVFRSSNRGLFSAGADITLMAKFEEGGEELLQEFLAIADVMDTIEQLPMPTVVQLEGIALGGGFELALACDFRIAGDDLQQIGLPETRLGLLPGGGGTQRLPRLVGAGVATEMIMKGMRYDAETALAKGLVHQVVPAAELTETVLKFAKSLGFQAPRALRHVKTLIRASFTHPGQTGLELERELFRDLLATQDVKEGIGAATENRRAAFTGN
ncbi:MAG: enoyl-CoA hydratase/isomerase family protein [Thermoleophilia bacterium]|nr:enoyl-CoA hydratase/isomerase family protein [Thermoleophilia bacterium]